LNFLCLTLAISPQLNHRQSASGRMEVSDPADPRHRDRLGRDRVLSHIRHYGTQEDRIRIKVNERLQTTVPDIWAMGDCAGSPMFTHVAVDDFRVVYDNMNGGSRTTRNRLVPFCLFTDPELVRVGRNESEARRDGIEYRLAKTPMAEALRTATVSESRGILKILIGKSSDEILGFTAFGLEASELLAAVQTAMIGRLPYILLRDAIFTHPTIAEGLNGLLGRVEPPKV
jgi:pyruvate/2-oxoglutarate dehydrogenase complex dihydrolipoamide dehydrogenase (E3) component